MFSSLNSRNSNKNSVETAQRFISVEIDTLRMKKYFESEGIPIVLRSKGWGKNVRTNSSASLIRTYIIFSSLNSRNSTEIVSKQHNRLKIVEIIALRMKK